MKLDLITGGDSKYFDLINELCESVNKLDDKDIKISVLDGGLSSEQVNIFRSKKIDVIDPGWPDTKTEARAGNKKFLILSLALPYLFHGFYNFLVWPNPMIIIGILVIVSFYLHSELKKRQKLKKRENESKVVK